MLSYNYIFMIWRINVMKISDNTKDVLKKGGFLTRDSRTVERKKYGRAKARRSFQFSKR